jgi:hypothetical protein
MKDDQTQAPVPDKKARDGWAEDAQRIASQGDDRPIWPELMDVGDDEWVW